MDMSTYSTGKKTEVDKLKEELARLKRHNAYVDKHWPVMDEIRYLLNHGDYEQAYELFNDLPDISKMSLDLAPSKGGMLKTWARSIAIKGVDRATGWDWFSGRLPRETE